jgi:hypothetical protein
MHPFTASESVTLPRVISFWSWAKSMSFLVDLVSSYASQSAINSIQRALAATTTIPGASLKLLIKW